MSISITAAPQYPVPNKVVRLTFAATTGTKVRLFVTSAPPDSSFTKELNDNSQSRIQVFSADVITPFDFVPDASGVYTFVAQEVETPTFPGAYKGDNRGYIDIGGGTLGTEKVASEASTTLHVGSRVSFRLGAPPDTATLVFWVWDTSIRATTLAVHGETSPTITSPATPLATTAANNSTVVALTAGLSGLTVESARGADSTIILLALNILNASAGHYGRTVDGLHAAVDNDNVIDISYSPVTMSPHTMEVFVNQALQSLKRHYTNDGDGTGAGSASSSYHQGELADWGDVPLFSSVHGAEETYAGLAECLRSYDKHRQQTGVHNGLVDTVDTINTTPPAIMFLQIYFLEVLASSSPAAAVGESTGVALMKAWGAKVG